MTQTLHTILRSKVGHVFCLALAVFLGHAAAQDPKAIVAAAVKSELAANRTDHTAFTYHDHDVSAGKDTIFEVVETPQGALRRKLEDHGRPLTPAERHIDDLRMHALMNDTNAQQKAKRDSVNDDQQAEQLLRLLPTAFLWTIARQDGDLITLNFKPDPAFDPDNMESRVLSAMAGEIVIARQQDRIRTIRGTLLDDVKFGYGLLGHLRKGGTFLVERREVAPRHWQMVESHVHMDGRALFFKTIGQQEDEVKADFRPSPAETLPQAYDILKSR